MDIFSKLVTGHRRTVALCFALLTVISALLFLGVRVNFNIIDYLPADALSTQALTVMNAEFAQAIPNARVLLREVSVGEALAYKRQLAELDGVSGVMWLDDVLDLKAPLEMADSETVEAYYKNGSALISLTIRAGDEVAVSDAIYALIGDGNALTGDASGRAAMQKITSAETMNSMLILVPLILVILVLSTGSWLEPLLFLAVIGVSIVINMGTNIFFGEVSFITNAVGPILQMAVSLDYAIFLLHAFDDYRKQTDDVFFAMRLAMKRALPAVAASAATTVFGFAALVFMRFRIGSDLGLILAKGILFSFISVMVFLPALTLCCYKLIDRTKHRKILPEFKNVGKHLLKIRIPALLLVLLLVVPSFLAQRRNDFNYGFSELNRNSRSGRDSAAVEAEFGRQNIIVLLVPKGDAGREAALSAAYGALEHVTRVVSYAETVGAEIPGEILDAAVTEQFYSERYSRVLLYTDAPDEGETAFALVEQVERTAREYYGEDFYALGTSVNLYDMKNVITKDNNTVNLSAIAAIAFVLLCTFRSLSLPVLLLLTIEAAIWINLSVPYFTSNSLCYIGYLVISTVQLGATVDYAILLSDHYKVSRKTLPKRAAIQKTLGDTFASILVSAAILSLSGFTLWFTSSNPIVSELGFLLGRGTILSMLLVVCFLPAALLLFDRVIAKTTLRARFYKEKKL
jgi:predicted RND superfamily exporter protein